MQRICFRLWAGAGVVALFAAVPFLFSVGEDNASISYLKSKPLNPWSIMALAAAGENPPLESLNAVSREKAIGFAAPILALAAAGENPHVYGNTDFIAALKSFYDGEQLGEKEILNDDIFGLLALVASGEEPNDALLSGVKNFILSKQNGDGGFAFAVGGASDTNTTAAAVMALRAAGTPAADVRIANALAYLTSAQNDDGGFPYDPAGAWGADSDASSDAWVIMALRASGRDPVEIAKNGATPVSHLEGLKQENGSFLYQEGGTEDSFTPVTTSYALLALSGKTLPVAAAGNADTAPAGTLFSFRIDGADETLCAAGEGAGNTALDAVRAAADECGLSYHMQSSSFGEYVDEIAGEKAAGMSGWLYAVNGTVPNRGAGAYALSEGDAVVWYLGVLGEERAVTSVPLSAAVPPGESGGEGGGSGPGGSGGDGQFGVTFLIDVAAGGEKDALAFGEVSRGALVRKTVSLANSGAVAVTLSTVVSGDALFRRYLRLGEESWREYYASLAARASTTTDVSLAVPADYAGGGEKRGTLIFFATPVAQ